MSITPERNTEIQKQATEDAKSGNYNPPKGDIPTDMVFGGIDRVAGLPTTEDIAIEERKVYDPVYEQHKK